MKKLLLLMAMLALAGCSTTKREAISESVVRFLNTAPPGAQFICDVTWHTFLLNYNWRNQAEENLKRQAARRGANVIVMDNWDQYSYSSQRIGSTTVLSPVKFEFWGKAYFAAPD